MVHFDLPAASKPSLMDFCVMENISGELINNPTEYSYFYI
jgi:hypothetical protein